MNRQRHPLKEDVTRSFSALDILHEILIATDIETVWALTTSYFRNLGFGEVLYGYSPDSHGFQLGAVEDMLLLSTLERGFLKELVEQRHYTKSITFNWAMTHVGIASFSMTTSEAGLKDFSYTPESLAFFARHRVETGFSIGFAPVRAQARGVMTVVGPPTAEQAWVDSVLQVKGREILTVATVAHRTMLTMPFPTARRLTPRQREVLEWLACGKSAGDVACIMQISAPTVEKHLRLAREALGVETTAHALIKATFLNQMFLAPEHPKDNTGG